MVDEGGGRVTAKTKARKLAWDIFKSFHCQTLEFKLYIIDRVVTEISWTGKGYYLYYYLYYLYFSKVKLTSVYRIIYIRSYLLFMTQVSLKNIL